MSFDKQSSEMLLLLNSFDHNDVKYIIVGGFAVNRYGYNRATGDLDIYLEDSVQNRENLIAALADMGYGQFDMLIDAPIIAGYCEIMMDDGMYADLMTDIPGLDKNKFNQYFSMATIDTIDGVKVRFLHYNHLIANKKATGRPKDQLDVMELERIHQKD